MKAFFIAALIAAMALVYGSDPHTVSALDYNGARALMAQMIASLTS